VPYFNSLLNEIDALKHNPIEQPKPTGGQMNGANDTSQSSTAEQDKVVRDSFRELFSRDLGQMLSMSLDLTIKEFAVNPYQSLADDFVKKRREIRQTFDSQAE
jgi:hypothetical protein